MLIFGDYLENIQTKPMHQVRELGERFRCKETAVWSIKHVEWLLSPVQQITGWMGLSQGTLVFYSCQTVEKPAVIG